MNYIISFVVLIWSFDILSVVNGAVSQQDEGTYLANFNQIMEASYSQVDDTTDQNINQPPQELLNRCKNSGNMNPTRRVTATSGGGSISASSVQSKCNTDTICIIPEGTTLKMDGNLNVGALVVRGKLEWTSTTQSSMNQYLCGGYIVVEINGYFEMDLNSNTKYGWIYIKNNGAVHPELRSRSFGTFKVRHSNENPTMEVRGRELARTWSLLSEPLRPGIKTMKLLHDPRLMGWKVGDRLGISPTESTAKGWGQDVQIIDIRNDGTIALNEIIKSYHRADFKLGNNFGANSSPALLSAEVVNLSRNIIITGDDFQEVSCDPNLPEAVPGEQTSVLGCRCAEFRNKCHVGLHTMQKHGGVTKIENVRVEKCGQRGIEGKYCLHFHKMGECPECLFKGNAIENSQQRGIIVHGTHNTRVEDNVLYNIRGANLYLEDGNEMWNTLAYNVAICPFPFSDTTYHGCTIPGTSNRIADTSDNQSGFFSRAGTNNFVGNRAANHFNGMFLAEGSIGRGEAREKVCESAARLGRMDGNTWHGNGRFGTYTLGFNYPKVTDQSTTNNGFNSNKGLCEPFDATGDTRGLPGAFVNHVDYGNTFVGHYSAGDLQHSGHYSADNNNNMYWKETKTFENGCGAHIVNGYYSHGHILLPDQATFIIENTVMGDDTMIEANHHCNVGTTGVLCMPTYVLHNVRWSNRNRKRKWVKFQSQSFQQHGSDQNHGGIFTLSPDDAATVKGSGSIEGSLFPPGYVSLVSKKFTYLLSLPSNPCIESTSAYGDLYDNGILCKVELRALKIYTRNLRSGSAPQLRVEIWYNSKSGVNHQGSPDATQLIEFHQIGADGTSKKQGYSVPVIPSRNHSYRISLTNGNLPNDWVIEFSDPVIGNRWSNDELYLDVAGRNCGNNGLITSQHDRKYIWGGDLFSGYLNDKAWFEHGACVGSGNEPPVEDQINCDSTSRSELAGVIQATQCPEKCPNGCSNNSYCDCGTESCQCKAGHVGSNCETDLCAEADCGEHGSCSATYLGGRLPVTSSDKKCICQEGWVGDRCDRNPCFDLGMGDVECSGNGTCYALSQTQATCECDEGFSGSRCQERLGDVCEGFCQGGSFPYFGCAADVPNKVALGCFRDGGCHYLGQGEEYPYDGFCTYKTYGNIILEVPSDPSPAPPVPRPTPSPVSSPVSSPSPTRCGCDRCTDIVWNTLAGDYTCGDRINFLRDSDASTLISVGITDGPFDEAEACRKVTAEFPEICTCDCSSTPNSFAPSAKPAYPPTPSPVAPAPTPRPSTFVPTAIPIYPPTPSPVAPAPTLRPQTLSPTAIPTYPPTSSPVAQTTIPRPPTLAPTAIPTYPPTSSPVTPAPTARPPAALPVQCGCDRCTDIVWNTLAGDYTCGDRINFLRDSDASTLISVGITDGPFDEAEACRKVTAEFPEICTCDCSSTPNSFAPSAKPAYPPTPSPVAPAPTPRPPTALPTQCGCDRPVETVTKRLCSKRVVKLGCPAVCNRRCTCKDKKGFRMKKVRYKCKNVGKNEQQPTCDTKVKKNIFVTDLCPKTCDSCFVM